jgi:probable HAF family extracellular repeat protein
MVDIGTLGGRSSGANEVNNHGVVVGYANTLHGDNHAFIYENGIMTDLNALNGIAGTGWTLTDAQDINNRGQIVGYGYNSQWQTRAFLLTPVPEPEVYGMLSAGIGLMGLVLRRRKINQFKLC